MGTEDREIKLICTNFWCKSPIIVMESEFKKNPENYKVCSKCKSFDDELSAGVDNNGTTEYAGERFEKGFHEVSIQVSKAGK